MELVERIQIECTNNGRSLYDFPCEGPTVSGKPCKNLLVSGQAWSGGVPEYDLGTSELAQRIAQRRCIKHVDSTSPPVAVTLIFTDYRPSISDVNLLWINRDIDRALDGIDFEVPSFDPDAIDAPEPLSGFDAQITYERHLWAYVRQTIEGAVDALVSAGYSPHGDIAHRIANSAQGAVLRNYGPAPPPEPGSTIYRKKPIPEELRWKVFSRDGHKCRHCGSGEMLRADHIIPESKGGEMTLENLQTLCRSCNSRKGNRPDPYLDQTKEEDSHE